MGCALQGGLAGVAHETLSEVGLSRGVWLVYSHLLIRPCEWLPASASLLHRLLSASTVSGGGGGGADVDSLLSWSSDLTTAPFTLPLTCSDVGWLLTYTESRASIDSLKVLGPRT